MIETFGLFGLGVTDANLSLVEQLVLYSLYDKDKMFLRRPALSSNINTIASVILLLGLWLNQEV